MPKEKLSQTPSDPFKNPYPDITDDVWLHIVEQGITEGRIKAPPDYVDPYAKSNVPEVPATDRPQWNIEVNQVDLPAGDILGNSTPLVIPKDPNQYEELGNGGRKLKNHPSQG